MIATQKMTDSVILATLLALLALPSCSWAQNGTEQTIETRTEELWVSSEATDKADEALLAESEKEADKRRETISAEATEALMQTEQALQAIKEIVPLIDAGEIKQAKLELETALQTVVLSDYITPLPYVRAENYLKRAEELAEMSDRSEAQNEELASQLAEVRRNLELGELLGYGSTENYASLHAGLDQIKEKTIDGKQRTGVFDKVRAKMSNL